MASACLYLFFAKPNLIVNTDLLIILGNYFSLICKAEILYPPQFYLKRSILIQDPWSHQAWGLGSGAGADTALSCWWGEGQTGFLSTFYCLVRFVEMWYDFGIKAENIQETLSVWNKINQIYYITFPGWVTVSES